MEIITPSVDKLTKGNINRYELVIATAKTAHLVVDEYVKQRTEAERRINQKETDKPLTSMINKNLRDERAVRNAITLIHNGGVEILSAEEKAARDAAKQEAEELTSEE